MKIRNKCAKSIIPFRLIAFFLFVTIMFGCNSISESNNASNKVLNRILKKPNNVEDTIQLPFIGIRGFETRYGVSGTGTPQWHVQIRKNRDVFFFYVQINQGDDSRPRYIWKFYAGKYKKYITCNFKEWDNFPRYYEITRDSVIEVDSAFRRLYRADCCDLVETSCPCKGEFWTWEKEDSIYVDSLVKSL